MNLFNKFFRKDISVINWDEVKNSDKAFPKHSFSILKLTMKNGEMGTGWVDKGYKNYEYKEFCPYNIQIEVDLTDEIAINNSDLDMGTIEDFFSNALNKICVCHLVSRLVSNKGMDIIIYAELEKPITEYLEKINNDLDRPVSFNYKSLHDPRWTKINRLF